MKKLLGLFLVSVLASSVVLAEGGKIEKSTVINATQNNGATAVAIGEKNTATIGSVVARDGIKDSTVINATQNNGATAVSIGKENDAAIGSVVSGSK